MKAKLKRRVLNPSRRVLQAATAFTLIEMIGVLAVIAILAALLIPRIFEAINNARINNAVVTCSTLKAAVADHYAKFGSIAVDGSTNPPSVLPIPPLPAAYPSFDQLLLKEGFLDKPFAVKLGDGTANGATVQVRYTVSADTAVDPANSAYDLGGTGTNSVTGSVVVEAVIKNVASNDAKDLNDRLDGTALGNNGSGADLKGRVKYAAPGANNLTDVYIYLTHR